ncbi:MAG: DUF4846 domain-containing protein, partial [Candidatus Delongbacteria bacterium]|nr:DUF4846 domain-containing protein [Candidatus Delongbacteria bacterium]
MKRRINQMNKIPDSIQKIEPGIIKKNYFLTVILAIVWIGFYSIIYCQPNLKNIEPISESRVIKDIPLPDGYVRKEFENDSFAEWIRSRKLKAPGTKVYLHNGELKGNQNAHYAVIDIDMIGANQQCADAVMRLRAEYLYEKKLYDKISFNFVSGFAADYKKWREGYSIKVEGNNCSWVKSNSDNTTVKSFREYLFKVFEYASTISLKKQMVKVDSLKEIKPGDVFIVAGSPGHAVIVTDVAVKTDDPDDIIFMVAQSYMPAQDIHILKNDNDET